MKKILVAAAIAAFVSLGQSASAADAPRGNRAGVVMKEVTGQTNSAGKPLMAPFVKNDKGELVLAIRKDGKLVPAVTAEDKEQAIKAAKARAERGPGQRRGGQGGGQGRNQGGGQQK